MLTTIKGIYDNGNIILEETPHVPSKTDVIVTFLEGEKDKNTKGIILGILKGKLEVSEDFDAPLDEMEEYM